MKIGILCEGENTDKPVLGRILSCLFPDVTFEINGVNKDIIFRIPDVELARLYNCQADRFLIIWDLLPLGHGLRTLSQESQRAKRAEQRKTLLRILCASEKLPDLLLKQARHLEYRYEFAATEIPHPNGNDDLFKLVCVCHAMDGWLLSDPGLLCRLLSTEAHRLRRLDPDPGTPDECRNPAAALKQCCSRSRSKKWNRYNKMTHNEWIAAEYIKTEKLDKMRVSESFCRVVDSIEAWKNNEG